MATTSNWTDRLKAMIFQYPQRVVVDGNLAYVDPGTGKIVFQYPQRVVVDGNKRLWHRCACTCGFQYPQRVVVDGNSRISSPLLAIRAFSTLSGS